MEDERIETLRREYMDKLNRDPFLKQPWIIMDRLVDVVLSYIPGPVIEIGGGHSTLILAKHAMTAKVPFYTCDTSERICSWIRKTVEYDGMIVYCGKSSHFIKGFSGTPSVVFLDGGHAYGTVKFEIDNFLPILAVGGVMFIHDTCPVVFSYERKKDTSRPMTSYLVRKELETREDVDVMTWRYTASGCGLTMVLKKDMSEPEYRR